MKLRYSDRAARQIDVALDYIAERSPRGAAVVQQRIFEMETLLESHPYTGHPTSRTGIRRLALAPHPYIVDYLIVDDEIVILRFRHGARRPL